MTKQIHKILNDEFVKFILTEYLNGKLNITQAMEQLKIKRRRFFMLLKKFRSKSYHF